MLRQVIESELGTLAHKLLVCNHLTGGNPLNLIRKLTAAICVFSFGVANAATSIATPSQSIPSSYNGMSEIGVAAWSPWPSVSFGTLRMWNTGTRWNQVETSRGGYNWSKMDSVVNMARSKGVDVIYTFGGTPRWASSNPNQGCLYGSGSCAAPYSMNDWTNYVTTVAKRYKGRIRYYELWNEPNDPHYYTGSISTLRTMAQYAYNAIKAVDPSAQVLTPCPTWGPSGSPATWMDNYLATGAGAWADGIAYHAYPGNSPAEFIVNSVAGMRGAMAKHGISKPLYLTEGGWGLTSSLSNQTLQANFLARYLILAWAKGVNKVVWYAYDDQNWGALWDPRGGLHKPGQQYNNLRKWLVGATMSGCNQGSDGTWVCNLRRPNGYSAQILWNPNTTKGFNVSTSFTWIRNLGGSVGNFNPGHVTVGPSPILIENLKVF